jgi:hypothetical protein
VVFVEMVKNSEKVNLMRYTEINFGQVDLSSRLIVYQIDLKHRAHKSLDRGIFSIYMMIKAIGPNKTI